MRFTSMRARALGILGFMLSILSPPGLARASVCGGEPYSEYAIVVDGGSTGSRLFVFNITHGEGPVVVNSIQGGKSKPGLSTFVGGTDEGSLQQYMRSLFDGAKEVVPEASHASTRVFIKATAGMRLTSEDSQRRLYDRIYEGLSADPSFPFSLRREDISTISGDNEGLYAVVSVNYLAGRIAGDLSDTSFGEKGPLGALDMGGASTQVVFHPAPSAAPAPALLPTDDFWGYSFLGYGVDQIRSRLWDRLAAAAAAGGPENSNGKRREVRDPCGFAGFTQAWRGADLVGAGDAEGCARALRDAVWGGECENHLSDGDRRPCDIDGVALPVTAGATSFFAMSVYFYALDAQRALLADALGQGAGAGALAQSAYGAEGGARERLQRALDHWPTPSLEDLRAMSDAFCGIAFGDLRALPKHRYTADDQLSHRCVEVNWIAELLRSGLGLGEADRAVTYALEVSGMEVEWTLGFVITNVASGAARTCPAHQAPADGEAPGNQSAQGEAAPADIGVAPAPVGTAAASAEKRP